jgi:hypothetical protein
MAALLPSAPADVSGGPKARFPRYGRYHARHNPERSPRAPLRASAVATGYRFAGPWLARLPSLVMPRLRGEAHHDATIRDHSAHRSLQSEQPT